MAEYIQQIEKTEIKDLSPCYIFWGNNEYDRMQIISVLKKKLETIGALDFDFFAADASEVTLSAVMENLISFPFLSPRKIVVCKNITSLTEEDKEVLDNYFQKL